MNGYFKRKDAIKMQSPTIMKTNQFNFRGLLLMFNRRNHLLCFLLSSTVLCSGSLADTTRTIQSSEPQPIINLIAEPSQSDIKEVEPQQPIQSSVDPDQNKDIQGKADNLSESADQNKSIQSTATESNDNSHQQMALSVPPETSDLLNKAINGEGPIIIDNDELVEQTENIKFEELPTDEGKTRIKTGAQFPVVVISQISSKTAKKGDPIEARLKYDLKIGDRLIAKKGAHVTGHINYVLKARSVLHSLVSPERWYRNSGCMGITFDEIINENGEHLPLVATPLRQARIVKNKGEGRELGVNDSGQITGPWSQQLRYKALRIGLNAAMAPAGVFSFGAMPVALGLIGAANPSFAFMKPVGLNVRHRRLKGFAWGFLSGIPGSWLIEDTVVRGQEAVIKPGDEFLAEFKQEFTGEPATEADLLPGASTKVRGQVVKDNPSKK